MDIDEIIDDFVRDALAVNKGRFAAWRKWRSLAHEGTDIRRGRTGSAGAFRMPEKGVIAASHLVAVAITLKRATDMAIGSGIEPIAELSGERFKTVRPEVAVSQQHGTRGQHMLDDPACGTVNMRTCLLGLEYDSAARWQGCKVCHAT
jgi:hypothetical protein